jgi:hypothetical protein
LGKAGRFAGAGTSHLFLRHCQVVSYGLFDRYVFNDRFGVTPKEAEELNAPLRSNEDELI